jgi:hypothetical protein
MPSEQAAQIPLPMRRVRRCIPSETSPLGWHFGGRPTLSPYSWKNNGCEHMTTSTYLVFGCANRALCCLRRMRHCRSKGDCKCQLFINLWVTLVTLLVTLVTLVTTVCAICLSGPAEVCGFPWLAYLLCTYVHRYVVGTARP